MNPTLKTIVSISVLLAAGWVAGAQPFSEDFTDATLNPGWTLESPNASSSAQLTGSVFNMVASWANGGSDLYNGSDYNAPRLLQPIDPGSNWLVEIKFDFAPANDFDGAGLLLARTNGIFTNQAQFSRIGERQSNPSQYITVVGPAVGDAATTTYIRVQKLDVNYSGWWSSDGVNWNFGGTATDTNQWTYFGIDVLRQPWDNAQVNAAANFYYFHVTPLTEPPNTHTWVGRVSSDWFNPTNWSPMGVPGGADTAIINSGSPVVSAGTNVGTIVFNGGSINAGPGLIVSNAFNWTNGSMAGTMVISGGAVANLDGTGNLDMPNGQIVNNGTVNWSGGAIRGNGSSAITNNGAWLAQCDNQFNPAFGGAWTFYNKGSFTKSLTTGTTDFSGVAFNNSGTATAQAGTLQFDGGGALLGSFSNTNSTIIVSSGGYLDGAFTVAAGSAVRFSGGTFTYGPALSLGGAGASALTGGAITLTNDVIPGLQLNGGTISLSPTFQGGSITNLTLTGSSLAGSNTVSGALTWLGGTISGVLYINGGGTLNASGSADVFQTASLTNAGHILWNGAGNWRLQNDNGQTHGYLVNLPGGVFDIVCNNQLEHYYNTEVFTNAGLLRKYQENGTTTIDVVFGNSGTVNVQAGTMVFAQSGAFGGSFSAGNGDGIVLQAGGLLDASFNISFGASLNLTGGTFTQTPNFGISGSGSAQQTGGTLTLLNGTIPNLQLNGGTVSLAPTFQNGVITNLTLNNQTLSGSNAVTGTLNLNNCTVNGPLYVAPGAVVNWTAGTFNGPLTIANGGTLNVLTSGSHGFGNSTTNAGTINWVSGEMRVLYNNIFYNQASGAFNIECDQNFDSYYGSEIFNNNGLVTKNGSLGNTTISLIFNNSASVAINSGEITFNNGNNPNQNLGGTFTVAAGATLNLNGGGALTGSFNTAAGGQTYLSGGTFTNTPTTVFGGLGSAMMTGGALTLISNTVPNLQINGGTVTLSSAFQNGGVITNLTLVANLSGSNYVTGTLTLSGDIDGPLTLASNAVLNWQGNLNSTLTLAPTATVNWSGGTINRTLLVPTNAVFNLVGSGGHGFASTITNAGTMNWENGEARLLFNNSFYNLAGALFDIQCDQSFDDYYGGESFNNFGLVQKDTTTGTTPFYPILNNSAQVVVQSGALNINNGTSSQNLGGTFSVASTAALNLDGGGLLTGTYTAAAGGTIYLTSGTFSNTPATFFNGAGSSVMTGGTIMLLSNLIPNLQITGGTVQPSSFFQQNGAITNLTLQAALAGSNYVSGTLNLSGPINGPLTVASNAVLNWGGDLNAALTIMPTATLNWNGGTINRAVTIPTNAALNLIGSGGHSFGSAITNSGTINWLSGEARLLYNNNLYNLAGATFSIQCDQTFDNYYGAEAFYNSGWIVKTNTTGATGFHPSFHNLGTLDVESGNITYYGTMDPSSGLCQLGLDGLNANGSLSVNGAVTFSGGLSVHVNNNYVLGLSNQFNLVAYSSQSGLFASTNLPGLGAAWQLTYGSTALTLQATNIRGPSVSLTSPFAGQVFILPGSVPLAATASDSFAPVTQVQFYEGTNLIGQSGSPYTASWNATPGYYTLGALAVDADGATATSAPVSIAVFASAHHATNFTWTGASSSDWFTAANWSPNGVPGALDSAYISRGTVNLSAPDAVSAVYLSGGSLQGAGVLTVTNLFNWTGGNLNGALTIGTNATFTIAPGGGINLNGLVLNNNGTVNWMGGGLNGNSSTAITNNGLWIVGTDNSINLGYPAPFVNNGTFRKTAYTGGTGFYNLSFVNNGTVDAESGTIAFENGGPISGSYVAASGAAVEFDSGTFTLDTLPALSGSGAHNFRGGTLQALHDIPSLLSLTGGTLKLGPVFQNAGDITNLTLAGSTLSGTNSVSGTMTWSAGSLSGQLTVTLGGTLDLVGGNGKTLSGSALINLGHVNWEQGSIGGDANSVVTNNGVWLAMTDDTISFGDGSSIFVNNGLFQKTAYTGRTYFRSMVVTNNGTMDAESGAIYFDSGGALTGTFVAAAGAAIAFDGNNFVSSAPVALNGAGTFALTGGNMTIASNTPAGLRFTGGTLTLGPSFQNGGIITNLTLAGSTLSGNYTVAQSMTFLSGTISGSLTVAPSATLYLSSGNHNFNSAQMTNLGTVYWSGGSISFSSAGTIVNNGLWIAQSDDQMNSGGTFINNATYQKQGTRGTSTFYATFNNGGTVDGETGSISFQGGGNLGGAYNTASFAGIYFANGSFTAPATPSITGAGACQFTGGSLTLVYDQIPNLLLAGGNLTLAPTFQNNGAITNLTIDGSVLEGSNLVTGSFVWDSGSLSGSQLIIATNGTVSLLTSSDKNLPGSLVINNGALLWNGGRMRGNAQTIVTNNNTWLVQCDYVFNNDYCCGNPSVVNNGLFEKTGTTGATTFNNVSLLNTGTINIQSGAVNFQNSGTYAQTGGSLKFGVSAPNLVGALNLPGAFNIDGDLEIDFLNGYTPSLHDSFAPVTYTSASGVFDSLNLPPLTSGQSWNMSYGANGLLLSIFPPPVTNGNHAIAGTVLDNQGHPIAGLRVSASPETNSITNLVQNGSFELPNVGNVGYFRFYPGSTNITNWLVIGAANTSVDMVSMRGGSSPGVDGEQYFDPTGGSGGGGIQQTFPTTPGASYELVFYHGSSTHYGINAVLGVNIGTNYFTEGETSGNGLDWRRVEFPFIATSNFTTLTFSELTGFDANDSYIDDVQVIPSDYYNAVLEAATDATGHYQISAPNGSYQVDVGGLNAAGYQDVAPQTVTVNNNTPTANFVAQPLTGAQFFTIAAAASPAGAGTATGGGSYLAGATVTLTATVTNTLPYTFLNWTENGVVQSTSPTYSFTALRNQNLVANFVLPMEEVTGTVSPVGAGSVLGGGSFVYGTSHLLSASAHFGYQFDHWSDQNNNVLGASPSLSVTALSNAVYTAHFTGTNLIHVVTTATLPVNLAAVSGAGTYHNGDLGTFIAPPDVTNGLTYYAFSQFLLNGNPFTNAASFNWTFATTDVTNFNLTASYGANSVLPLVASARGSIANPVKATANYVLTIQFDRAMNSATPPLIVLTNAAPGATQPDVPPNGLWSTNVYPNDTYTTPAITFAHGMDGTNLAWVSQAVDLRGDAVVKTNVLAVVVDATPPLVTGVSVTPGAISAIVNWNTSEPASSEVDYGSTAAYGNSSGFDSRLLTSHSVTLSSLAPLTQFHYQIRSRDQAGNETDTADSTFSTIAAPDLQVTNLTISPNLTSGSSATVFWTITNSGSGPTFSVWYDHVVVSNLTTHQSIYSADSYYDPNVNGNIAGGGVKNRSLSFQLPDGANGAGTLKISVTANVYSNQFELTTQNNNTTITAASTLSAYPDLQVAKLSVTPAGLKSGGAMTIQWNDTNSGSGPVTAYFADQIVVTNLTTGVVLYNSTLQYDPNASGVIAAGHGAARQVSFTLPNGLPGVGKLAVAVTADINNTVFEDNGGGTAESNNTNSLTVVSTLAAYPDLVVTNITVPVSVNAGQSLAASWVDINNGVAPATNTWTEQVLLSSDGSTNTTQLIASYNYTAGLAAGHSVTNTHSISLPGFVSGNAWLVVRINPFNQVFVLDHTNNTSVSTNPVDIVAALTMSIYPTTFDKSAANPAATGALTRYGGSAGALSVALSSDNTGAATVPSVVTIPAGQSSVTFPVSAVNDNVVEGTRQADIVAAATGYPHVTNVIAITDETIPTLTLSLNASSVNVSSKAPIGATITRNTSTASPLTVSIVTDPTQLGAPATVTIPAGSASVPFNLQTVDAHIPRAPYTATVNATLAGYAVHSASLTIVDDDAPTLALAFQDQAIAKGAATQGTVTASLATTQAVTVLLHSSSSDIIVPATVVLPANQTTASFTASAVQDNLVTGDQTAMVTASIQDAYSPTPLPTGAVTKPITVTDNNGATLSLAVANTTIAENGSTTATVTRNTPPTNDLVVTLNSSVTDAAAVPATVTILSGQTSKTFTVTGVNPGVPTGNRHVTLTASASGFGSGAAGLDVSDINIPDLVVTKLTVPSGGLTTSNITITYVVANKGLGPTTNSWHDSISYSTAPDGSNPQLFAQTYLSGPLAVGQSYTNNQVVTLPNLPGTIYIVVQANSDGRVYEGNYFNDTMVSGALTNSPTYHAFIQADLATADSPAPIPMHGYAYSVLNPNQHVPSAEVEIDVAVKGTIRSYNVLTDTHGNFTNNFYPIPGEAGHYTLAADYPDVADSTPQSSFDIYGLRFSDIVETYKLYPDTNVNGQSTLVNPSDHNLTGVRATVTGLPANVTVNVDVTNEIDADDMATLTYSIITTNITSAMSFQAKIQVTNDEGAGSTLPLNITLSPEVAVLVCNPTFLQSSMLIGQQTFVSFDVQNIGGAPSGPVTLELPSSPWLSAACATNIASLAPGQSNRFMLALTPAVNLPLQLYNGSVFVAAQTTGVNVPFAFRAISDAIGGLQVSVQDEYTFYVAGSPLVTNAQVVLTDPITGSVVASGNTGQSGVVQFPNLDQGSYQMTVSAVQHSTYQAPVAIAPGQTAQVNAFVQRQTVSYTWVVVPTTIQDNYQVQLQAQYETEVPIPVVTIDNPLEMPVMVTGTNAEVDFQVSNHGLIAAEQIGVTVPTDDPNYIYTPLTSYLDEIPAMSTVTIPVLISWRTNTSNSKFVKETAARQMALTHRKSNISSCQPLPKVSIQWSYVCGDDRHWHITEAQLVITDVDPPTCAPLKAGWCSLKSIMKGGVSVGTACSVYDCIKPCINDPCLDTLVGAACGIANDDASGAINNALHSPNCICPNIPPLTLTVEDGGGGGGGPVPPPIVIGVGGGGGQAEPTGITVTPPGWSFAGCTPGQVDTFSYGLLSTSKPGEKLGMTPTDTNAPPTTTAGDVCAHVTIQLDQQVALTRNAFLGTLTINNGDPTNEISNLLVAISILDDNSNSVNSLFGIPDPTLTGVSGVDGTGVIAAGGKGTIQYTFVPTHNAAPTAPVHYRIGGQLSYVQSSNTVTVPLAPQDIYVYPDPVLDLDYFLQRDVIGDDPNAPGTIAPQPFNLGLMVRNVGAGDALNFTITSAQPTIVENSKGLLINFQILDTKVGTNAVTPSLTADLGGLAPHTATVAVWDMICSLAGRFVSYSATFQHLNSLGNVQTSLIDAVNIHQMIHTFLSVRPGDDNVPDFLVNDIPNPANLPDTVYLSDGSTNSVTVIPGATVDAPIGPNHMSATLTASMTGGWNYLEAADPGPSYKLYKVVRSDGLDMKVPYNAWTTPLSFPATQTGALHTNVLHLVDYNGSGSYTLFYHTTNTVAPTIVSLQSVSPFIQPGAISSLQITFSEAIDLSTFNTNAITLTKDGQAMATPGLSIALQSDSTYLISGLGPFTGNQGNYTLTVNATNVQDYGGNNVSGNPVVSTSWAEGNAPLVVQSVQAVLPNPRNTPVNTIVVNFDKAVNAASFDYHAISLTLNSGPNLSSSGLTVTPLSSTSFQIGGLAALTGAAGDYVLKIDASAIQDSGGLAGSGTYTITWTVITTGPTITSMPPPQSPRNIVVLSQNVTFSEPIDPSTFTTNDLSLTLDGGSNLISGAVQISQLSPTTFQINNFTWVSGYDGHYTMTVDATKVRDLAGNPGLGSASVSWQMSTHPPSAPANLALTPITGVYPGVTRSNVLTLSGTVATNNVAVRIVDQTTGEDFGSVNPIGTNFSATLDLAQGSHQLQVYAVDDAANVSANSFITVSVDQTPIAAKWDTIFPNPRLNAVTNVNLTFNKGIDITTLFATNITLTVNGTNNYQPTLTMVSSNVYTIGGLAALTAGEGTYTLTVNYNGVRDAAGNIGSGTGSVTWQNVANQLPAITQIGNVGVSPGQFLRLTFSDSDPLQLPLTLELGPGAPTGLVLTNGVLAWTPACEQGATSNWITLWAVETAASPLSNSMSFAIIVRDCLRMNIGSAIVPTNATGSLPVNFLSTGGLTNITFTLDFPTNRFANWGLANSNAAVASLLAQPLNSTQTLFTINARTGQVISGSNLGSLTFGATAGSSAFVPFSFANLAGFGPVNGPVATTYDSAGRIIILGPEPLLEAQWTNRARNVLLYGLPGNSYALQTSSNLDSVTNWSQFAIVAMTNYLYGFSNLAPAPGGLFYRADDFIADPPILNAVFRDRTVSLTAFGIKGTNYELQFTPDAGPGHQWNSVSGYTLSNAFEFLTNYATTNSSGFYRLKKK